jgi:four helix bundle protein
MKDFRSLKVWEKAHAFVLWVYKETAAFPTEERYGLTSQMRRAAVSVPNNLAEGCGRGSDRDMARFIQTSLASASEVEYLLLLSRDLGLLPAERYPAMDAGITEIKRMLTGLIKTLKAEG